MKIDEMAEAIHKISKSKGFWDDYYSGDASDNIRNYIISTKLCLVHSEVTETLEAIRKSKADEIIRDEIADILIRTFDLFEALYPGESVEHAILEKMNVNAYRPKLHGNKF